MAKPLPLSLLLEKLSQHLAQAPADIRDVTGIMMSNFARNPERHERATAVLTLLLQTPTSKPEAEAKVKHLRLLQGGGAA